MISRAILIALISSCAASLCAQQDTAPAATNPDADVQMAVPPPVNVNPYPTEVVGEARSNYLRAGVTLTSLYSDNVFDELGANPTSDVSYSVWPFVALDETTARLHAVVSLDPGFTFYQRTSGRNEADDNFGLNISYRLSPHVTFNVADSFHRSSNFLNQPLQPTPSFGSASASATTVVPPLADQLNNTGTAQLVYQFGMNAMVGISGTLTNLDYLNRAQVPGLFNSLSRAGSAFYDHRISRRHYLGATYQYQALYAYPTGLRTKTKTSAATFFYTLYVNPTFSISLFGGPEYSETQELAFLSLRSLSPAAGASVAWQGRETNLGVSYSRMIAPGGGLIGAVHQDAASLTVHRRLTRAYNLGLQGSYSNTQLLESPLLLGFIGSASGHAIQGTASLGRQLGTHFALGLNYTRLHQSYSDIAIISRQPNTNQGSISLTYQFARPLGR
jgi:hypothetical protein